MAETFTVLDAGRAVEVTATMDGDRVRLSPATLGSGLGWTLEREGLCRGPICIAVRDRAALADASGVDLATFASLTGRPLAVDAGARVAYLGIAAAERARPLAGGEAPDFRLPDLDGRLHALSDHRGKKILLVAHASW